MSEWRDYFELFGLPRRYEVEQSALDAAYEQLSLETHPDFLVDAGDAEKAAAQRKAAEVNEGYRVLRDEPQRSAYLLRLLAAETERGGDGLDTRALPDGFLQEMFMLQEEIEELDEDDRDAKARFREQIAERREATRAERAGLFARAAEAADAATLQAIQSNLNQDRYLQRLEERLTDA